MGCYILNQDLMNKPGFAGAKHQFENQVLGMTDNQFEAHMFKLRNQQNSLNQLSNQLDTITIGVFGVAAIGFFFYFDWLSNRR